MSKSETLQLRGTLEGHTGWVTALATTRGNPDLLVSASRDHSLLVWQLTPEGDEYAYAIRALRGHTHIVQDVTISQDATYVLSASWDKTLRLWSLNDGGSTRFVGHEGDVLSCAFSIDNSLIVSSSRDKTIRLWNVINEHIYTIEGPNGHDDWITKVQFTPHPVKLDEQQLEDGEEPERPIIVSAGWDKTLKVWDVETGHIISDFIGHNAPVTAMTLSPDGTMCGSGGKDGSIIIWDLQSKMFMFQLQGGAEINALAFSPTRFWIAAATANGIGIFELEQGNLIEELKPEVYKGAEPVAVSLVWSVDGQILFSGYTDNKIRVWQVMQTI